MTRWMQDQDQTQDLVRYPAKQFENEVAVSGTCAAARSRCESLSGSDHDLTARGLMAGGRPNIQEVVPWICVSSRR